MRIGTVLFLALILQGCIDRIEAPAPVAAPYQRFVPVATSDRDFALDTKTGKLCKTWAWTVADSPLNSLPECTALYSSDRTTP